MPNNYFIISEINDTVRFISNIRQLKKTIKRKYFPIPKGQYLLLKVEDFR